MSRAASPASVTARIMFAALALVVCVWFAIGVRAFKDEDVAITSITGPGAIPSAKARADRASLIEAATLNPDQNVNLLVAQLDARTGNRRAALTIADQVTRREPDNIDAWLLVSYLVPRSSAAYRQAAAHVHLLAPPVPQ